jgi:hypothetical protein
VFGIALRGKRASESHRHRPAAISANPAVTMIPVVSTAPDKPAARANGTVGPSDMPMTMSRTVAVPMKWRSMGGWGIGVSDHCGGLAWLLLDFMMAEYTSRAVDRRRSDSNGVTTSVQGCAKPGVDCREPQS